MEEKKHLKGKSILINLTRIHILKRGMKTYKIRKNIYVSIIHSIFIIVLITDHICKFNFIIIFPGKILLSKAINN